MVSHCIECWEAELKVYFDDINKQSRVTDAKKLHPNVVALTYLEKFDQSWGFSQRVQPAVWKIFPLKR